LNDKSKEKVVEEKEKSGIETVLNVFKKDDRGRGGRDRGTLLDTVQYSMIPFPLYLPF
jgi:hypothetical protein